MRFAYLLTTNENLERTQFSKKVLENIGFTVICFKAIQNNDKVLSNKLSMMNIYYLIQNNANDWSYVFEDDINVVEPITIEEIIEYEKISSVFFYLGCCIYNKNSIKNTEYKINNVPVSNVCRGVRGLHGIGITKTGANQLLNFAQSNNERYMDVILEEFTSVHPANIVRYDLISPQNIEHRGVLYQDRNRFPTTI
jgi:hypothetical protein